MGESQTGMAQVSQQCGCLQDHGETLLVVQVGTLWSHGSALVVARLAPQTSVDQLATRAATGHRQLGLAHVCRLWGTKLPILLPRKLADDGRS